ncbi:MAG: acyl carrier protein [Verrucomicrobiales bacterium]
MENELIQILQTEVLSTNQTITRDSQLFEAGLDSMAIMQLLLHIEDHFHVILEPVDLSRENFQTVPKIVELINSKR